MKGGIEMAENMGGKGRGMPRKKREEKCQRRAVVMLPAPVWEELRELAFQEYTSLSSLIRRAVCLYLLEQRGQRGHTPPPAGVATGAHEGQVLPSPPLPKSEPENYGFDLDIEVED